MIHSLFPSMNRRIGESATRRVSEPVHQLSAFSFQLSTLSSDLCPLISDLRPGPLVPWSLSPLVCRHSLSAFYFLLSTLKSVLCPLTSDLRPPYFVLRSPGPLVRWSSSALRPISAFSFLLSAFLFLFPLPPAPAQPTPQTNSPSESTPPKFDEVVQRVYRDLAKATSTPSQLATNAPAPSPAVSGQKSEVRAQHAPPTNSQSVTNPAVSNPPPAAATNGPQTTNSQLSTINPQLSTNSQPATNPTDLRSPTSDLRPPPPPPPTLYYQLSTQTSQLVRPLNHQLSTLNYQPTPSPPPWSPSTIPTNWPSATA